MTDEEIIEIRTKALKDDLASINNRLHHAFNQGFELGRKSTTPKEKTGKWIYTGDYITDGMLKCTSCGYEHDVADRFLYCPNCGARMVSE